MLPISKYKNEIIETVRNHAFTIVSAETGSGKSTQIPQYLANYYSQIVVTEPRIMAAKTLAKRVSEEMKVTLGQEVGYRTAYDKCSSKDSKILYCTDGLQLIRTIFSEDNEKENVLIIDEVHEWNLNIETLIAWCKFMREKWNTKVVIMSATLDTDMLANFFGEDVAVLNIPGTLYDVKMEERPKYKLIDTIKEYINDSKNVLVFVPGKKEISDVISRLHEDNATVLPLHGEMDWDDQKKCFEHYANSKVIVATNVAQTSLTIPDIDIVVDTGEARVSIAENGIQGLFLEDISQSDIMQRKGRAGRTKDGKYILCSDISLQYRKDFSVPEIKRSILDRVVLQLAAIGLDAEKLEFYHQPDVDAIKTAKKELEIIGAIDSDNKVTEMGYKIVKMPVSVQLARMIVEADKYGVTEQVMTIAAIIEMGGLLAKEGNYYDFTSERTSDLLAELDVWNYLNKMKYIDFKMLGIKKKTFFKIKEHIQKLKETLYGIVEIKNNDDRNAVLKSCLYGLVSHIYVNDGYDRFVGDDGIERNIDKNSCVKSSYFDFARFLIGIPKTIEFKDRWGEKRHMNLISFASRINGKTIMELVPNAVKSETELHYSKSEDAIEVTEKKTFAGYTLDSERYYDYNHPLYDELKSEYESERFSYENINRSERQMTVEIDGKEFKVDYFGGKASIFIDAETLYTTKVKNVFLDNGEKVWISSTGMGIFREELNITALKNAVENSRLRRIRENKKREYSVLKATKIEEVISNSDKIGKIELTMDNGGYGDTPVLTYGCISLKKNTVSFEIIDDEELANSKTIEALQYLFIKKIEKKYGMNKFSHQEGKKKKVLTDYEKEMKEDFDSLVREILLNLTIENAKENLEFLEEYYQELMRK